MVLLTFLPTIPARPLVVELEHETEGVVDFDELVVIESSDELTETLVCDCGCLLDEYSSLVITDGDRRPEDPRR